MQGFLKKINELEVDIILDFGISQHIGVNKVEFKRHSLGSGFIEFMTGGGTDSLGIQSKKLMTQDSTL
jgi:hypothetical protein